MADSRILVADDDTAVLQTMSWVLKEHGFDVVTARDAERLFELLDEKQPDLVLLDVVLPDSDGYHVLERMKGDARWRDIPVLMVSALPPEEAAVRTLGLGAADFVKKPFRVKELLARIQAQLRMRGILRSAHDALREAEQELERVREEAESRRKLVDILHDVTTDLSPDEIYHLLARRVARALDLTHCSVILARSGERPRVVATAFEQVGGPAGRGFELDLDRYPEIRAALEHGKPVLVEDVSKSELHAEVRERWRREGTTVAIRSVIALPFALDAQSAGVFFLRRSTSEPALTEEDVRFADTVVRAAVGAAQRAQALEATRADNRRLEMLALTDPLTGVLNRRALTERLAAEMGRVRRYESTVSVLLIDVDHFKNVNDTWGHLIGDSVLTELASLLQGAVRAVDVVARYGGEEFVVVLPETVMSGATTFAERLREQIEGFPFASTAGHALSLTGSIGVASYPSENVESVDELLAAADQALYRAKAAGRNRVVFGR
ncbi:MAG: diguanylate cyclase [Gemmatimonadota bacterium]